MGGVGGGQTVLGSERSRAKQQWGE
jgi:hypothetical protein